MKVLVYRFILQFDSSTFTQYQVQTKKCFAQLVRKKKKNRTMFKKNSRWNTEHLEETGGTLIPFQRCDET